VPTGPGATVRANLNLALQALATENEGATAPSPTWPFMAWRNDSAKLLRRRNASNTGWEIVENYGATRDPGTSDDAGLGYVRSALWINEAASRIFICLNPTTGAAVWAQLGAGAPA
jgi:hypothetical protein